MAAVWCSKDGANCSWRLDCDALWKKKRKNTWNVCEISLKTFPRLYPKAHWEMERFLSGKGNDAKQVIQNDFLGCFVPFLFFSLRVSLSLSFLSCCLILDLWNFRLSPGKFFSGWDFRPRVTLCPVYDVAGSVLTQNLVRCHQRTRSLNKSWVVKINLLVITWEKGGSGA